MSFEPIPEPSASSDYLRIKEGEKHRIRIMGSSKDPATFIQGWEAWGNDNKPVRAQYELGKPCPQSLKEIDRDGKPKLFWMFIVWHVDQQKPMVFEVTQQTIKSAILSHTKNKAWGDPANYVLEIGRTGTGMETEYTVIAEPPVEPPAKAVTDAMKDAAIDVRVVFEDGNPFGALGVMPAAAPPVNDQENVKRLREEGKPIPMGEEQTLSSVGDVAADAVASLKAAQAKSTAVQDDIPF